MENWRTVLGMKWREHFHACFVSLIMWGGVRNGGVWAFVLFYFGRFNKRWGRKKWLYNYVYKHYMCGLLFLLISFHLQPSSTCTYSFQLSQIGKYDFAHFIIFLFACQMVPIPCSHFSWWLFIYSEMLHYYYKASRMEYVRIAERIYRNADPTCFRTTKIWIIMDIIFSLLRSIINCQLHGLLGNGNNSVY